MHGHGLLLNYDSTVTTRPSAVSMSQSRRSSGLVGVFICTTGIPQLRLHGHLGALLHARLYGFATVGSYAPHQSLPKPYLRRLRLLPEGPSVLLNYDSTVTAKPWTSIVAEP